MKHLLYSLLTWGLLGHYPATARPAFRLPLTAAPLPILDSLHVRAQAYSRYLTYALQLQGRQPTAVQRSTEAYLRALATLPAGQAPDVAEVRYRQAMQLALSPGQYGTFCWLQEREHALQASSPPTGFVPAQSAVAAPR